MKNNKGQSLIDVIFSIAILVLVLTGVVVLVVSTAKVKRIALERQKAIELSQRLIDAQILTIKNSPSGFWDASNHTPPSVSLDEGYSYVVNYNSCNNQSCNVVFTINWGDSQSLSVERLFSRKGI